MREIIVSKNEEGYQLRKLCIKVLSEAPNSFIYKMLRKKNIVLNDKKASGTETLKIGDSIKFYLSNETFDKFSKPSSEAKYDNAPSNAALDVIYEDEDFIFCNKPANMLSQKANKDDVSINEIIIAYLLDKKAVTEESLKTFKPSVCNRLDRNTSGIILASKSPKGARFLTQVIKDRSIKKYYNAVVLGKSDLNGDYTAYLSKDEKNNKVTVKDSGKAESDKEIKTVVETVKYNPVLNISLLKIELVTGKSHQIRAHLAYLGFPIIGDMKYGSKDVNTRFKKDFNIKNQMLSAVEVVFPKGEETVSGKSFSAALPDEFKIVNGV